MADNRLYGGNVVNPSMLGGASATPQQSALSGYTGSGQIPFIDNSKNLEYDPYHQLKLSFTSMMGQTFEKAVEHTRNRAYVQGMSSQVSGMAEEAMETNILTRAWSKAGYRDMEGRVALTNYKASVLKDLESGRLASLTPTEFQQYLNKQRDELMPYINNSSMLVREKLLERAVEEDVGLIQKHSEYHTKFIYDQELNSWNMDFSLQLMDLDASAGSYSYNTAIMNVGSTLGMLMQNDRISQEDKVKMATQVISSMSYAGHVQAADAIRNMPIIPTDSGEMLPLRMFLTPEEDLKIQKGIETGYKRNKDQVQMDAIFNSYETLRQVKANPLDPNNPDRNSFVANQLSLVQDGLLSMGQAKTNIAAFDKAIGGDAGLSKADIVDAYYRGKDNILELNGISLSQASRDFLQTISHLPPAEQVKYVHGAMLNGQTHAPTLMGVLLENGFSRLINGGEFRPEDEENFNAIAQLLAVTQYSTAPANTLDKILSGFRDQSTASVVADAFKNFKMPVSEDPGDIANALKRSFDDAKFRATEVGEGVERAVSQARAEMHEKIDKDISPSVTNLRYVPDFISSFGGGGELRVNVIPNELWNSEGNLAANRFQAVHMNAYVRNIYDDLQSSYPGLDPESLVKRAKQTVAQNMTMIQEDGKYGLTFIGNPATPILGVLNDVNTTADRNELFERTLKGITEDAISRDARAEYGNLAVATHFTGDVLRVDLISRSEGLPLASYTYGIEDIRTVAQEEGRLVDEYRTAQTLNSLSIKGKSGQDIKLHPNISDEFTGVIDSSPEDVVAMRTAIVTLNPDYRQPTKVGGRTVIGTGIVEGSKYYPKNAVKGHDISPEEFNDVFTKATSEAIYVAESYAVQVPPELNREAYMGVMANIALLDPEGLKRGDYDAFNNAVYNGDKAGMLHALSNTRFWDLKAQEDEDIRKDTTRAKQIMNMQIGVDSSVSRLIKMVRDI